MRSFESRVKLGGTPLKNLEKNLFELLIWCIWPKIKFRMIAFIKIFLWCSQKESRGHFRELVVGYTSQNDLQRLTSSIYKHLREIMVKFQKAYEKSVSINSCFMSSWYKEEMVLQKLMRCIYLQDMAFWESKRESCRRTSLLDKNEKKITSVQFSNS